MTTTNRIPSHPDFYYAGGSCVNGRPYFAFDRTSTIPPAQEVLEEYRSRKKQVESLGGQMRIRESELSTPAQEFTFEDEVNMIASIRAAFPEVTLYSCWNGEGCYSFSVSVEGLDAFDKVVTFHPGPGRAGFGLINGERGISADGVPTSRRIPVDSMDSNPGLGPLT